MLKSIWKNIKGNLNRMAKEKRLIIVGAGSAGGYLLKDIKNSPLLTYKIVGFLDDSYPKKKRKNNFEILGKIEDIQKITKKKKVEEIIIAIPSTEKERLKYIFHLCQKTGIETKILPSTYEVLHSWKTGKAWYQPVREIQMEDLLKRKPVLIDFKEIKEFFSEKTILITGAGGSIGKEICKQIAEINPNKIILLDNCEFFLYNIEKELKENYPSLNIQPIIGDIRGRQKMADVFYENRIDIVFHSAAYKHVPLMESNIKEAIKNNVFGTYNVLRAAKRHGVKDFVLISTDKAVNPTSIMGVTKRITEKILQIFQNGMECKNVRFGNVMGSRGSVIPLFEQQIKKGGPITITHPEMTRFFMTISEAAQLVIQAAVLGENGDLMMLDMGDQYKIKDIVDEMIKFYGLIPNKDIKIKYTGMRPGEKLKEEIVIDSKNLKKTENKRIFIDKSQKEDINKLKEQLSEMLFLLKNGSDEDIIKLIKKIVPEYKKPREF